MPHPLAIANAARLEAAARLLEGLTDEQYRHTAPPLYQSGVGAHLRHCLEHYQSLCQGQATGSVDYDARPRDQRIEEDRAEAIALCRRLAAELSRWDEDAIAAPLRVRSDCGDGRRECSSWSASTLGRELQAMASHSTHHFALMAIILRLQGLEPGDEFGLAPATLLHLQGARERAA